MSASPELVRAAIAQAGLLDPYLSCHARRAGVVAIANRYGCSEGRVYDHLKRLRDGAPARTGRSDRNSCRALSDDVRRALHAMCVAPKYNGASIKQLHELLCAEFPAESITYATVRNERARFLESIPKVADTPRRVEVAHVHDRYEMDLSIMDAFVADPRYEDGYPFRPQLVVCEDSRTRCCMYAQYTQHGRALDVGSTLYNAIIPQNSTWPQSGVPREIGADWGKVFTSEYFDSACAALGIKRNLGNPYHPQDKGKCERMIGSIHNGFENILVGFTTNDNKGEGNISPRKDFRQDAGQWIDPRFDKPLMTLDEANRALWDWISGTYHIRKHSTLGCSPNDMWLRETRGMQITIPVRATLEMQFLPFETRTVRRGKVQLWNLEYWDAALGAYEGMPVQVRYTPDDISRVYVYHGHTRVAAATPSNPFIASATDMDWSTWQKQQKANREAAREQREFLERAKAADITIDPAAMYADRAAAAAPLMTGEPDEMDIDPRFRDLTEEERENLSHISIFGHRPFADAAGQ